MIHVYQVTVIAVVINDWPSLRKLIFFDAQPVGETYGGNVATYTFDAPQTPADLGPLVKVELLPNP